MTGVDGSGTSMSNHARARIARRNSAPAADLFNGRLERARPSRSLDTSTRQILEQRLGHDFSAVRLYTDEVAAKSVESLGASAVTIGRDVQFAHGAYAPDTPAGFNLLAHELAHVVQNARHPTASADLAAVSEPSDCAEREASSAAARVSAGARAEVTSAPAAVVSRGVLDWIEDTASGAWEGVTDVASGAVDLASDAGSAIASGAGAVWDTASDAGSSIYEGMKFNAGLVHDAEKWAMGGIDWLEGQAKGGVGWLADQAEGIPVLEQIASGAEWGLDQYIDFEGGVLKGATGLVGGVANVVANPIDTAIALEQVAEHVPTIPGMPNPFKAMHAGINVLTGDEEFGDAANRVFNPMASMEEDSKFMLNVGRALIDPYVQSVKAGKPAEALGRAGFDIAAIVATAGGEAAVEGAGAAGRLAGELGEVSEGLRAAEIVSETSEGLRAAETVAEASEGIRAAETLGETAEGVRATETLGETADHARIAEEVAEEGRRIRTRDIREAAREVKQAELAELRESGLVNQEYAELAEDIGPLEAEALAEGEIGLKEAGVEVSHEPFPLAEGPEYGDVAENLRARARAGHREGIHGRNFNKGSEFQPVDPLFEEHKPLQSVRQKGRPALTPNEIDEAADAGAVEQWADRERAIDELIDRSRDPEKVAEALEGGKGPGKGRGGPRLSEEARLEREQAALDESIASEYEGSKPPKWMQTGAETGTIEREWAEAMEWMRRLFGGG